MEIEFGCECGTWISKAPEEESINLTVKCSECGARYAITVTRLQPGNV